MCVTDNNLNGLMALTLKCISEVYQDASFFFFRIGLHEVASIETLHGGFYRPRSEEDNVLGSVRQPVCLSVRPSVSALTAERFDLRP